MSTFKFDIGQRGQIVGFITIKPGTIEHESFEFAAWFRDHELRPGVYPVVLDFDEQWVGYRPECTPYRCNFRLSARVPSVIKDACLVSSFGGMQYGPDSAGQREIGTESEYHVRVGYGHKIDDVIAGYNFVATPEPSHEV